MAVDYNACIALSLLLIIFTGNAGANMIQRFLIEPQDMEVDQGTDVTFQCQVNFLLHDQILAWFALDRQVTRSQAVIAEREDGDYALNVIAITFINLVLDSVQPSDDGMYSCAVVQRHTDAVILRSRIAVLIVNFPPDPHDPICTPTIATVHVNEFVTITCDSKTGKPPIDLVWTRNDGTMIDAANTTLTTLNLRTILTYGFTATLAYQGVIFECTATSHRFLHYREKCTVTVDVQFPPEVNITTIPPDDDQDFPSYNCTAIGNPDPFTPYVWEIDPPFPDTTPIISTNGTILSFDAKPICRQTTTGTCTATNIKGSGNDTVIICEPIPTTTPASAGRRGSDGETTTVIIIVLLLLVLFAVLGLCFMYRRKQKREREQLLTSQPPQNININVDPHININISGAETLARGNLQEGQGHDNLGINPAVEDESFYLPMGDVKPRNPAVTITKTVTSETKVSATYPNEPEDIYINEDNVTAAGLKPRPKTRKGNVSPKLMPKPIAAPRSPHLKLKSKKGLVQALKNGFTFRKKRTPHTEENEFNMDDPADYELYKKGEDNVYEGLKTHQPTDYENNSIWDTKKMNQAKFVEEEGAYDLAGALRMKLPPSNPEAKISNQDSPTNYYSPVAGDQSEKSANIIGDPEEYSKAELYGAGANNAKQSHLQNALLAMKTDEVSDSSVDGDYDLVGTMLVKPPSSKSATKAKVPAASEPEGETYAEAKMYGTTPSAVGLNKKAQTESQDDETEGEVYADAKMYGVMGNSKSKLEVRKSVEVSQDVDVEGGGFGKMVERSRTGREAGDLDLGKGETEAEDVDSGMIYQEATFHPGISGMSDTAANSNKGEEDSDMIYEEPIRSNETITTRSAVNTADEPDSDMLYEEPIRNFPPNASRSAVTGKNDSDMLYEEPIINSATNASRSLVNKNDEQDNEMLYEEPIRGLPSSANRSAVNKIKPGMMYEKPIRPPRTNPNKSQNTAITKEEDEDDDMIYQEATLYGTTVAANASRNNPSKTAVFADNPDEDLDGAPSNSEDESIYAEATLYGGARPVKKDHPKIPKKPVVGKKTATLIRNDDMDLTEFDDLGDEDRTEEESAGHDSDEGESLYEEATLYGSVGTGKHKPPVATPRKTKLVAKKSATLVRQDSNDF